MKPVDVFSNTVYSIPMMNGMIKTGSLIEATEINAPESTLMGYASNSGLCNDLEDAKNDECVIPWANLENVIVLMPAR